MHRFIFKMSAISLVCMSTAFAAVPVDLSNKPAEFLKPMVTTHLTLGAQANVKQVSRNVDFNQTTHIRIKQMYSGYPVWGSDAIVHIPHNSRATLMSMSHDTSMNGTVYQNLNVDLNNTPAYIFTAAQSDKALQQALLIYKQKTGISQVDLSDAKKELMVYVDKDNKAHWSFLVAFFAAADKMPAIPTYIMDATSFAVYEEWNDLQTLQDVSAGGFGGNSKSGKIAYDGATGNYPVLAIQRDAKKKICYLRNADVIVFDGNHPGTMFKDGAVEKFSCNAQDKEHNNLYWDASQDQVNGGFSPANDALYIGQVIKEMYGKWYGVPALAKNGKALMLKMNVHAREFGQPMDNAMFRSLNNEMYFGDGVSMFYPLSSLGVGAHEISHGFTALHSNLVYKNQSGGLNEAFSDMAAQAAEFYSKGSNSWQIGPEIVKGDGALRYMDNPTKDGHSIDNMKNYSDDLNVHYTSGIFNKLFYLMGSAQDKGWTTRKAFDVMVKANMNYWTSTTTFAAAACGVVKATKDYKYDMTAVTQAMKQVGLDISNC